MMAFSPEHPKVPQVRPKSEIYSPERDDEHPNPFHMRGYVTKTGLTKW